VRYLVVPAVLAAALLVRPTAANAQSRPSPFYFSGGIGGARFTPSCDSGCVGDALNANSVILVVGWHLSPRLRVEAGGQYNGATGNSGSGSHAGTLFIGAALYPVGNLFVRGGVGQLSLSVADTAGVTEGKGGPGYTVGVGYDLFLSHSFAITPYANYFGGSIKNLTYTGVGTFATGGSVSAVNFGVSFTYRKMRPKR